ncbi:MAG: hypothetical protein K0S20_389 [Patescibacteria group bacterium]|jgi:hypothetical protein|nr:hypothetical protein [Patescibacteria group bacterium]
MPELVSSHHETPFQESRFATGLKGMFGRAKKMLVDAGDKYFFEPEVADTPEQPPHSPTLAALEQSRESIGAIYKRALQGVAESSHSAGTKLTELFKNSKPKSALG